MDHRGADADVGLLADVDVSAHPDTGPEEACRAQHPVVSHHRSVVDDGAPTDRDVTRQDDARAHDRPFGEAGPRADRRRRMHDGGQSLTEVSQPSHQRGPAHRGADRRYHLDVRLAGQPLHSTQHGQASDDVSDASGVIVEEADKIRRPAEVNEPPCDLTTHASRAEDNDPLHATSVRSPTARTVALAVVPCSDGSNAEDSVVVSLATTGSGGPDSWPPLALMHRQGSMVNWRHVAGLTGVTMAAVGVAIFVLWPRNDVPRDPDAVVVLGGAGPERVELGIAIADQYQATLVLSSSAASFARDLGIFCGRDALCMTPNPPTTTGEARTVARLVGEYGWDHVTVATARFHTTRARVLFRQCLGDRVTVVGAAPPSNEERGLGTAVKEAAGTMAALTVRRAC
jgi:hypothetical protein